MLNQKNGETLGFAGILINFDVVEIMNIVVKKSYRNQGIGKSLLNELINLAKQTKLNSLMLEVNSKNEVAIELYKKFEFKEVRN